TTWTTDVPGYPNGAVVTPDGDALLVVEAKAERVARIEIRSDGSAGRIDTFVDLPRTDADGLALDAEGHLWVTLYRPDGLVRVAPDGTIVERIDHLPAGPVHAPTQTAL